MVIMDIGFIGLGHLGFPMARRLIEAGHHVTAFDTRSEALDGLAALGARPASSPKEVADRAETVMASLPSPHVAIEVATGAAGVVEGGRVRRYVDLSTVAALPRCRSTTFLPNARSSRSTVRSAVESAEPTTEHSR